MTECVIVGGGVVGLSLAYELATHGWQVRVLDRQEPGREASWAGAGILPPANQASALHPLDQLRGLSHRLHGEWAARLRAETGIDTGYRPCGGIYFARTVGEAAALHGFADEMRSLQVEIRRLDPAELRALEPAVTTQFKAAYLLPGEAQLRNPHHLRALAEGCVRRGVRLEPHREVVGWDEAGGRIRALRTHDGEVVADQFCFTTGAWTHGILFQQGVRVGVFPVRGQMVLFRCPQRPFTRVLNDGPRYLVPRDDGHVLVGSTEEEAGFDKSNTAAGVRDLVELATTLVPALKDAPVERTWAGLRPGSFDSFPYIGGLPGLANAYVAAGHFRSGLHMSPGTAVVLGQLIRGLPTEIDLQPFRVQRG